jgi:hypothetical protein
MFIAAGERDYNKERLGELFQNDENAGVILSFSVLDEKIHSTKQGLDSLADEISLFYQNYWIYLIKSITQGRNIHIFSDHGFVENKNYSRKDKSRFSHGGNTFLERIVPFTVYKKSDGFNKLSI